MQLLRLPRRNTELKRRTLTQAEIAADVKVLIDQGHKRLLLVSGEEYPKEGFNYILKAIDTIYKTKSGRGEIRRVNVNIAPLTVDQFKRSRKLASALTSCSKKHITAKPTPKSTPPARRKTSTGA